MIRTQLLFNNNSNIIAVLGNYAPVCVKIPESYKETPACIAYLTILRKTENHLHDFTNLSKVRELKAEEKWQVNILLEQRDYIVKNVEEGNDYVEFVHIGNEYDKLIAAKVALEIMARHYITSYKNSILAPAA